MRNRFDNLSYFLSKEDRPFGRTTGADHTTAAGVGYEEVMTAFFTPNPILHTEPSPCFASLNASTARSLECHTPERSKLPSSLLSLSSRISPQTGQDRSSQSHQNCFMAGGLFCLLISGRYIVCSVGI